MDLRELHARVQAARQRFEEPPPPGGSKPILPLTDYFDHETHALLRQAVRAIRKSHPTVFINYAEGDIAWFVVEDLAVAEESVPTLEELAQRVDERFAEDKGPWLVSTPLCNIELREPAVQLADGIVIWRAHMGTEWLDDPWASPEDESEFEVFQLLSDRVRRPTRWKKLPDDQRLDARIGATVLSVETASLPLALARARARVRYAIGGWAILAPPAVHRLLPELASWVPQPHIQISEPHKRFEVGNWIPKERPSIGSVRLWQPYEAPGAEVLRIPFDAVAHVDHRSAQAVLSASLALLQASRGTRFNLSERLRYIHAALDALCEPSGAQGMVPERWAKIAQRYEVWEYLAGLGYLRDEIEDAQKRLYNARNVATHGSDAVLLDLGYPPEAVRALRKGATTGVELGVSGLESDLTPMLVAVRQVLRQLWQELPDAGWDDQAFEERFA